MREIMRTMRTKNFVVRATIEPDHDLDMSWDDSGEVQEKLESGEYYAFQTKVAVYWNGAEISADYLGGSVYANPRDFFREHIGARGKYGSYFRDMVSQAIGEARKNFPAELPYIRR